MGQEFYMLWDRTRYMESSDVVADLNRHSSLRQLTTVYLGRVLSYPGRLTEHLWTCRDVTVGSPLLLPSGFSSSKKVKMFSFADVDLSLLPSTALAFFGTHARYMSREPAVADAVLGFGQIVGEFLCSDSYCVFPNDCWPPMEEGNLIDALEHGMSFSQLVKQFSFEWGPPADQCSDMWCEEAGATQGYYVGKVNLREKGEK